GGIADINGNFLWSDAFNWDGDVTAPIANDSLTFGGTLGTPLFNDLAADTAFAGLTFNTGTGGFTIAGNRITLGGNVVYNASNAQTLNQDLLLGGDRTFTVRAGGTTLGGGTLNIGGIISDGGSAKGITLVNNNLNRLQVG